MSNYSAPMEIISA